jgi:hypothetical protein
MIFVFFSGNPSSSTAIAIAHNLRSYIALKKKKKKGPGSYPTHQNLCTQLVLSSKTSSSSSFRKINLRAQRLRIYTCRGVYTHI